MKNYFSRIEVNANVIYQDEFYEQGRVISKSLKAYNNIKTIGVQHGLFDLHHTVYGISSEEFDATTGDPIPVPDLFVVWGDYFKKYFVSNHDLNDNWVTIWGNPKYFKLKTPAVRPLKKIEKILWCTDTPELTMNDMLFLERTILNNPDFEITIRMHPFYNFLKEYQNDLKIFERFPKVKLSENYSIVDDINQHDLVIVNCYTTAFLDTYLKGKYCLRLFPYKTFPAYLKSFKSRLIFNIFSEADIFSALEEIYRFNDTISIESEFKEIINIDIENWRQLLTERPITEPLLN